MPRVYNKRRKGYPEDAVLIDRTTPYGNPIPLAGDGTRASRWLCLCEHAKYLQRNPALVARIVTDLKDKDILYWCAPLPCHGHTLIGVANSENPAVFLEQAVVNYRLGYRR